MPNVGQSLPTVVSNIPRDVRMFLDRVRELLSESGDNALVTEKSLVGYGLINTQGKAVSQEGEVYATPPAITGLAALGAFQNVIISWDTPTYANHAYTEVWASPTFDTLLPVSDPAYVDPATLNDLSLATPIATAPGGVTSDQLGGAKGRYYWVRGVNTQDTVGPFNAVSGVLATTAPDVAFLLTTLTDSITQGQLATALSEEIDLIAQLETFTGYVDSYSGDNLVTRLSVVDASVVNINASVSAINSTVATIDAEVSTRSEERRVGKEC